MLRSCERIRHGEGARMRDGVRGITAGPVACKGRVAATVSGWLSVRVSVDAHIKIADFKRAVADALLMMYKAMLSK